MKYRKNEIVNNKSKHRLQNQDNHQRNDLFSYFLYAGDLKWVNSTFCLFTQSSNSIYFTLFIYNQQVSCWSISQNKYSWNQKCEVKSN